jgi:DNA gyrase subunit A
VYPLTSVFVGQIRAQGRNTRGAVAMRLKGEDKMASMDIIPAAIRKDLEMVAEANPRR